MSVVELLQTYGTAFWKSKAVSVTTVGDAVRVQHPGFYESVDVRFTMMQDFNDVDAAVMMTCKPTGRHGYVSCFRREILVRPCGDALSEHVVAAGIVADRLATVVQDDLRYTLGPASTVLRLTFSHLYPLDCVDLSKEYSIIVEPAYVQSILDDDLGRRLSQMKANDRLRQVRDRCDVAIDHFMVEISAVMRLHLKVWDVPEAIEYGMMESKRRAYVEDAERIGQIYP